MSQADPAHNYEIQWLAGQRGQLRTERVTGDYYEADGQQLTVGYTDTDEPVLTLSGLSFIVQRTDGTE